jgi:O-antigen ligase
MYLLKISILNKPETLAMDLIASIALAVFGGLLIISKQSLYCALHGSRICNALLFRILGFSEKRDKSFIELLDKDKNNKNDKNDKLDRNDKNGSSGSSKGRKIVCFLIGMIFGILTFFVSPIYICLGMMGIIILYAILCYPEAGFLGILFVLPFLPPGNLIITGAAPCILVSGCYFLKLIRGKRTFTFQIFDLFVLMFCGLILFSGFVSVSRTGSIGPALIYFVFTLIYFTGVNMIRSKEMILRCISILAFSGFLVAAFGIYQNYFGGGRNIWHDGSMFGGIANRVGSTLGNPNVLGTYLILIIPFLIVAVILFNQIKERMQYMICLLFTGICLVFTWSRGSWLAFLIAVLILFVILNKKVIAVYAAGVFVVPFAPVILPEMIISRFLTIGNVADSSTSYRVSIWQGTINMLRNHFFEGIGIGVEPFRLVYPEYALSGIESAPHSHSLYLQIFVEFGILGLLVFLPLIFFFLQCCFTAMKKAGERYLKLFAAAGLCSGGGFLLNGFTDLVWYNYRVYMMFWLIISITVAICRFALKNQPADKIY